MVWDLRTPLRQWGISCILKGDKTMKKLLTWMADVATFAADAVALVCISVAETWEARYGRRE